MSLTAAVWLVCFIGLATAATRRAAWAFGLYWLTYYASPPFWWWGAPLNSLTMRWSLLAAVICAVAVVLHRRAELDGRSKLAIFLFGLYALNAALVHATSASDPVRSYTCLTYVWKYYGLFVLGLYGLRSRKDFELALWFIIIGSAYIGYEVVVNDRGTWNQGRLELKVIPMAGEANALAGLLAVSLPMGAAFLLGGRRSWRTMGALTIMLVFIFETVIRCNSRATFLSLFGGGFIWLLLARGKARKRALLGLFLVAIATSMMVKNEKFIRRFKSIFVAEEERDSSAKQRIILWKAALRMLRRYPFGKGGECAFRSPVGRSYTRALGFEKDRAVHNGYLDIACGWGVQGLAIYLGILLLGAWNLYKGIATSWNGDVEWLLVGAALIADLIIILVCAMFTSTLDNEWMIWWFFLSFTYGRISQQEAHQRNAVANRSFSEQATARVVPELVPAG